MSNGGSMSARQTSMIFRLGLGNEISESAAVVTTVVRLR